MWKLTYKEFKAVLRALRSRVRNDYGYDEDLNNGLEKLESMFLDQFPECKYAPGDRVRLNREWSITFDSANLAQGLSISPPREGEGTIKKIDSMEGGKARNMPIYMIEFDNGKTLTFAERFLDNV